MNVTDKGDLQLSSVFGRIMQGDPSYIESVIDRALEHRAKGSEGARSRLNSAIDNGKFNVSGFRGSAKSRAPNHQLRIPMTVDIMSGNDRLAGAAFMAWMESQKTLKDAVTEHLTGRGITTGGIDARKGAFDSLWPRSEWEGERDALREAHGDFEEDDIALMLCCVSGMAPEPLVSEDQRIESELFRGWVEELKGLDSEADDWLDLDMFKAALSRIGEGKATERVRAQSDAIEDAIAHLADEYSDEMQYLGIEVAGWPDDGGRFGQAAFTSAREAISSLKEGLDEYRPIRPQASTRELELERAADRLAREKSLLDAVDRWGDFVAGLEAQPDALLGADGGVSVEEIEALRAKFSEVKAEVEELNAVQEEMKAENERLNAELEESAVADGVSVREYDALRAERDALASENVGLKATAEGLEADKRAQSERISRLRGDLSESNQMARMWRRNYEDERAKLSQMSELEPSELGSVREALELAERTFPDQLLLALNSKSDKNSPFQKPDEVFGALRWLATEYHSLRTNPGSSPDFNMLLKQSCPGWSYKPGQTEVTKEQFSAWYTTSLDGKSYELQAHLAKGTSHDPQNTMRIAFAWDDDSSKVVVGYLGLHQRNRRSA